MKGVHACIFLFLNIVLGINKHEIIILNLYLHLTVVILTVALMKIGEAGHRRGDQRSHLFPAELILFTLQYSK